MDDADPASKPPRMPRWVKVSLIVGGVVLVLAGLALALGGGGEHGPGRHSGGGSMDHGEDSTATGSHTQTGTHHSGPMQEPRAAKAGWREARGI